MVREVGQFDRDLRGTRYSLSRKDLSLDCADLLNLQSLRMEPEEVPLFHACPGAVGPKLSIRLTPDAKSAEDILFWNIRDAT